MPPASQIPAGSWARSPRERYLLGGDGRVSSASPPRHRHHRWGHGLGTRAGDSVALGHLPHPERTRLQVCRGISRVAKETSQLFRGESVDKGDKSIKEPIFIGSLMILPEKPDEGGGEGWREMGFHCWAGREVLCGLGGWKVRALMLNERGNDVTERCPAPSWEDAWWCAAIFPLLWAAVPAGPRGGFFSPSGSPNPAHQEL